MLTVIENPHSQDPLIQHLRNRYAKPTWTKKRMLVRYVAQGFGAPLSILILTFPDLVATIFCNVINIKFRRNDISAKTAREYTNSFTTLLPQIHPFALPCDIQVLRDFGRSFIRLGALFTTEVAIPLDQSQMITLVYNLDLDVDLRAGLWLAWKTASRWDDVWNLPLPIQQVGPETLFVLFLDNTKMSQDDHMNEVRFMILVAWNEKAFPPPPDVLNHLTTKSGTLCKSWTTPKVETVLAKIHVPESQKECLKLRPSMRIKDHYTAHSIKRGMIKRLYERIKLIHSEPEIALRIIMRVAKHKNPRGEEISATHVGYLYDRLPLAEALQTDLATVQG